MFPPAEFNAIAFEVDQWDKRFPLLKLDDLQPKDESLPIKMSFMMSFTNNRRTQLARSLECLARQTWKEFEVLLCDDGSTQDMEYVYNLFRPYLRLKTIRLERSGFSACPSRGFRALYPLAQGDVLTIMQPEMMLVHEAADFLYHAQYAPIPADAWVYYVNMDRRPDIIDLDRPRDENAPRFVCVKTGFLDANNQFTLDAADWHSDTRKVETMPDFWIHGEGLSHMNNIRVLEYNHWPWWFVASMKKTDSIWNDLPHTVGHASIDFFLLNYRAIKGYIDICPKLLMAYHQYHSHNTSSSPIGEQDSVSAKSLKERLGL